MGPDSFVSRQAPPRGGTEPALQLVPVLDRSHRERQTTARAVTGTDGHLAGDRVGVERPATGQVRRTLGAAELLGVPELERERAGVVDRQALLQLELLGEAAGAVVGLVVQVRVVVDRVTVGDDLDLAVRAEGVERRQRRLVRERQVDVLRERAGVLVVHRQRVVLTRGHVAPGEGRVVDRGAAAGGDLDLADRSRHATLLDVPQGRAGVTDRVVDETGSQQESGDEGDDAGVDALHHSVHVDHNSSIRALLSALPAVGALEEIIIECLHRVNSILEIVLFTQTTSRL